VSADTRAPGGGETTSSAVTKNVGLRGVSVADTMVSHVYGDQGRLIYRGYDIDILAERSTYEEVAYLLIYGELPVAEALDGFSRELGRRRALPAPVVGFLRAQHHSLAPIDLLQSAIPPLALSDPAPGDVGIEAERLRAVDLVAKMASLTAAWDRIRRGVDPVPADPSLGHAADFLRMLHDAVPQPELSRELDTALILHADHSLNASTFVARAVTSTRAHIYAAVSAALGALSGELHGGANARVMEMLEQIGDVDGVEPYVRAILDASGRIMGMGHAVYRTDDPRAVILRDMSRRAGERSGEPLWYEMTARVEEATRREFRARKGSDIYPNVDMYSASLYHVLGIPRDLFTPIFALSRVAGWGAHVVEERFAMAAEKPALYRPLADYVGSYCGPESCTYVPTEERE
jgi:citrate synthase